MRFAARRPEDALEIELPRPTDLPRQRNNQGPPRLGVMRSPVGSRHE